MTSVDFLWLTPSGSLQDLSHSALGRLRIAPPSENHKRASSLKRAPSRAPPRVLLRCRYLYSRAEGNHPAAEPGDFRMRVACLRHAILISHSAAS
jgi:hypothetical protein